MERWQAMDDLRSRFPRGAVGAHLAALAEAAMPEDPGSDAYLALREACIDAARHANVQYNANAFRRDGDLSGYFAILGMGLAEAAAHGRAEAPPRRVLTEEEIDRLNAEEWAREDERERIEALEEQGYYGRTLQHLPEMEGFLYLRFGAVPRDGRSHFGLAREDTEDGPDPWRVETGGKRRESGICVLRAYRHPDVPGAYVLVEPARELALYGVPPFEEYLASIGNLAEAEPSLVRVDGSPVTCLGRDRTVRVELGSDGEYLIDPRKPYAVSPVDPADVWVDERTKLEDVAARWREGPRWGFR